MYDAGKVISGLVVFVVLVTLPLWFTSALGEPGYKPDPELPTAEKHCVESREYMKAWHMDLLNNWRDAVVRDGKRVYVPEQVVPCGSDTDCTGGLCVAGKCRYRMSLSGGCMKCHTSKSRFCDRCHNFMSVAPYCWDCHVEPKGD